MRGAWLMLFLLGCESGQLVRVDAPVHDALVSAWVIADESGGLRRGVGLPSRRIELAPGERLFEAPLTTESLSRAADADLSKLSEVAQVDCNVECRSEFDDSLPGYVTTDVLRLADQVFRLDGAQDDDFQIADDADRALFECIRLPRREGACAPILNETRDFQPFGPAVDEDATIAGKPAQRLFDELVRIDDDHLVVAARRQHIYWLERGRRFRDEPAQRVAIEEHQIDPTDVVNLAAEGESDASGRRHMVVFSQDNRADAEDILASELHPSKALALIVGPNGFESKRAVRLPEEGVIRDVAWIPNRGYFVAVGHQGAVWTSTSAAGPWVAQAVEADDFRRVIATGSSDWPIAISTRGGAVWLGDVDELEIILVFHTTTVTSLAAHVTPATASSPERLQVWAGGRVGQTGYIERPGTGSEEHMPGFPSPDSCGREPDACGRYGLPDRLGAIAYVPTPDGLYLLTGASTCGVVSVRPSDDCATQLAWPSFGAQPPTQIVVDDRRITVLGVGGTVVEVPH